MFVIETFKLYQTNVYSHLIAMGNELLKFTSANITRDADLTTAQNIRNILDLLQIRLITTLSGYCKPDQIPLKGGYSNLVASSLKVVTGDCMLRIDEKNEMKL